MDCPKFRPLRRATAKDFRINEVSADSAYASYDNMDDVAAVGGTPFILYKSNAKPKENGGTYKKMFRYYNLRRDEFMTHYHKRSNVETTFSMVKMKFGDSLRSKTDVAMIIEALCKIVCHKLCCLVHSAYELGITATFWGKEMAPVPAHKEEADSISVWAWV